MVHAAPSFWVVQESLSNQAVNKKANLTALESNTRITVVGLLRLSHLTAWAFNVAEVADKPKLWVSNNRLPLFN
jgi:hypothetical protein